MTELTNIATAGAAFGRAIAAEPQMSGAKMTDTKPQTFDDILENREYQAEFDKRVSKAIETAKTKWNEDFDKKLTHELEEAEKLAKMSADEKLKFERQKQEKDYNDRLAAVTMRELKAEAKEQLVSKGLPAELAETLNYTSAESCKASMEAVEKAFGIAVENAVNGRLKGAIPKAAAQAPNYDAMSDDEYYKTTLKK